MIDSDSWRIGPTPGYTPAIGHLVSMLTCERNTTIWTVKGLTTEQPEHLHDSESNSIGALLMHMAANEHFYATATFQNGDATDEAMTEERFAEWLPALDLGDKGRAEIRGNELEHYLSLLESTRSHVLEELAL